MKNILISILSIGAALGLILFILPAMGLFHIDFWGTKYADANRKAFEHSKSFTHGTIRDLENLRLQYLKSEKPEEKKALLSVARHRAATINNADLSPEIREFLNN